MDIVLYFLLIIAGFALGSLRRLFLVKKAVEELKKIKDDSSKDKEFWAQLKIIRIMNAVI